ncbi:RDD family protein [Bdellovibrio svalbardensis]|uniref:RDD family protein n=1 Tax=Bdellovibrio svalbardensis TaxID=2972972 RepID=A0ABT6DMY4_9BACT|nr:RDD family protein [Bdellovibrio svalbardensis]MDG0818228.1 RDD family protein [Bdellovibrio svalbardensis]
MEDVYVPSTWKRLFAFGIDQIFILLFYFPFAKTFVQLFFTDEDVYVSLGKLLVMFLVPALYEFVFLMILQATPGKWLLGLKVVPAHNAYAELQSAQCILRPLVSRLSFFFAWAIYAFAFFKYDRTHVADWVAETRVIQFTPRPRRPQIRWILGVFLVLSYVYEGVVYSSSVLGQIDWASKRVELRSLLNVTEMVDVAEDGED